MRSAPAEVYAGCPGKHFDDYQPKRDRLTGDEFLSTRVSKRQHAQNPVSGGSGGKMLHRVNTDEMVKAENFPVGGCENLSENIKAEYDGEVAAARVSRRQQKGKQQCERRIKL